MPRPVREMLGSLHPHLPHPAPCILCTPAPLICHPAPHILPLAHPCIPILHPMSCTPLGHHLTPCILQTLDSHPTPLHPTSPTPSTRHPEHRAHRTS